MFRRPQKYRYLGSRFGLLLAVSIRVKMIHSVIKIAVAGGCGIKGEHREISSLSTHPGKGKLDSGRGVRSQGEKVGPEMLGGGSQLDGEIPSPHPAVSIPRRRPCHGRRWGREVFLWTAILLAFAGLSEGLPPPHVQSPIPRTRKIIGGEVRILGINAGFNLPSELGRAATWLSKMALGEVINTTANGVDADEEIAEGVTGEDDDDKPIPMHQEIRELFELSNWMAAKAREKLLAALPSWAMWHVSLVTLVFKWSAWLLLGFTPPVKAAIDTSTSADASTSQRVSGGGLSWEEHAKVLGWMKNPEERVSEMHERLVRLGVCSMCAEEEMEGRSSDSIASQKHCEQHVIAVKMERAGAPVEGGMDEGTIDSMIATETMHEAIVGTMDEGTMGEGVMDKATVPGHTKKTGDWTPTWSPSRPSASVGCNGSSDCQVGAQRRASSPQRSAPVSSTAEYTAADDWEADYMATEYRAAEKTTPPVPSGMGDERRTAPQTASNLSWTSTRGDRGLILPQAAGSARESTGWSAESAIQFPSSETAARLAITAMGQFGTPVRGDDLLWDIESDAESSFGRGGARSSRLGWQSPRLAEIERELGTWGGGHDNAERARRVERTLDEIGGKLMAALESASAASTPILAKRQDPSDPEAEDVDAWDDAWTSGGWGSVSPPRAPRASKLMTPRDLSQLRPGSEEASTPLTPITPLATRDAPAREWSPDSCRMSAHAQVMAGESQVMAGESQVSTPHAQVMAGESQVSTPAARPSDQAARVLAARREYANQFRLKARRHAAELAERAAGQARGEGSQGATTPVHSAKYLRDREVEGGLWGMAQGGGFAG